MWPGGQQRAAAWRRRSTRRRYGRLPWEHAQAAKGPPACAPAQQLLIHPPANRGARALPATHLSKEVHSASEQPRHIAIVQAVAMGQGSGRVCPVASTVDAVGSAGGKAASCGSERPLMAAPLWRATHPKRAACAMPAARPQRAHGQARHKQSTHLQSVMSCSHVQPLAHASTSPARRRSMGIGASTPCCTCTTHAGGEGRQTWGLQQ